MMDWIKCTDRLPQEGEWVLVYDEERDLFSESNFYINELGKVIWIMPSSGCGCCDTDLEKVTHWCELRDKPIN